MNELKRELSKLSGIDFFNPKYRDVFKKYFPEDEDAEEKRLDEILDEEPKAEAPVVEDNELLEAKGIDEEPKKDDNEKVEDDNKEAEEVPAEVEEADKAVEDKVEDIDKAEDEREIDKIEEDKAEDNDKADEKAEEVNEESHEIGKDVDDLKDELFDTKLELELVHNNVRDDKLETAKDYLKYRLGDNEDLEAVKDILKEFPEWVKKDKHEVGGFGMAVNEIGDNLTAEERRLKQLGIDPRA